MELQTIQNFIDNKNIVSHFKNENITLNKIKNSIFIGDHGKRYIYYNNTFYNSSILQRNNVDNKNKNPKIIESFDDIFIFTEQHGDKNMYHWLYEYAPNFFFLFDLLKIIPNIKIIINKNARYKNNIKELLLFVPGLKESNIYEFEFKSVCLGIKSNNLFIGNFLNYSNLNHIWEKVRPKININKINIDILPKKIYISRRKTNTNSRKLINIDEISEYIIKKGYTEIFFENKSMSQKLHLLENCDELICELGAGMANFFMCKKTLKTIILLQKNNHNINFLYSFKNIPNNPILVYGTTFSNSHNGNPINTPWKLDCKKLQNYI